MGDHHDELARLWSQAVEQYTASKPERPSTAIDWSQLVKTNADLTSLIDEHESKFQRFRNHRRQVWDVFAAAAAQLQRLGRVVEAGIGQTTFAPACIILEAGFFLMDAGSDVTDTYDALETLFKRIQEITNRLVLYLDKDEEDPALQEIVVRLLASILNVFGEVEATIQRKRGRELVQRIIGKENKVQKTLKELDDMLKTEMQFIASKTYKTTRRIHREMKSDRDQQLLHAALHTDAIQVNAAHHSRNESSRVPHSGDWLLNDAVFERWTKRESPVLWILGRPGTGKTYLASRVIEHMPSSPVPSVTGYFYITEGMNSQHTLETILKSIAYQISRLYDDYRRWALRVCKEDQTFHDVSLIWDHLFIKPFSDSTLMSRPAYIIIDGVDEATKEDQASLVRMAKSLSRMQLGKSVVPAIQLLLLGRPDLEYAISNAWSKQKMRPSIIHMQSSLSKVDIQRYIKRGVREVKLFAALPPERSKPLRRYIIKSLERISDGMFMIAKLMLAEISNMNKPELIKQALAKPPSGLDDMFKRVVARISVMGGFDKADLNEMIMWVACARRDLLLGELDLVLKLRDLRQNGIVRLEDELRTRFGSFFSISHAEPSSPEATDGGEVEQKERAGPISTNADSIGGRTPEQHGELYEEKYSDSDDGAAIGVESDDDDRDDEEEDDDFDASDIDDDTHEDSLDPLDNTIPVDDDSYDEIDDNVPANFFVATVKFGHASIGQHFREASFYKGIGMDSNFTQAHIATTCLLFLSDNIPKRKQRPWRQPDLFQYAADHFLNHLAEIDIKDLELRHPAKLGALSDEIGNMFYDSDHLRNWFNSVSDKFKFMDQLFSPGTCSRLQDLLPTLEGGHDSESKAEWGKNSKASKKHLLAPFAQSIAKAWLLDGYSDGILATIFLQGYVSTWSDSGPWKLPFSRTPEGIAEQISPEEIQNLASIGWPEPTPDWHFNLGYTLKRIDTMRHQRAAIEQFQKAASDVEDSWRTSKSLFNEARGLYKLEEFDKTIVTATKAMQSSHLLRAEKIEMLELIQYANHDLGCHDDALEASRNAMDVANDPRTTYDMIRACHFASSFDRTCSLVSSLVTDSDLEKGGAVLSVMMEDWPWVIEYISFACAQRGQLQLAHDAFKLAARYSAECLSGVFRSSGEAIAEAALGQLHFRHYKDDKKATQIWENVTKCYPGTLGAARAACALAPLYLLKAEGRAFGDAEPWLGKLEGLVAQLGPEGNMSMDSIRPTDEISALIGRWYTHQNDAKLARAKVLPLLKLAIEELRDTDVHNDHDAYTALGRALLCLGDHASAEIAYAFAMPLQKSRELIELEAKEKGGGAEAQDDAASPEEDTGILAPFLLNADCDGRCSRREADFRSFSFCEVCIDIGFCDECLAKVKNGRLSFRICDSTHPYIEAYPPRGLIRKIPGGHMIRTSDGQEVSFEDWLGNVSKKWLGL